MPGWARGWDRSSVGRSSAGCRDGHVAGRGGPWLSADAWGLSRASHPAEGMSSPGPQREVARCRLVPWQMLQLVNSALHVLCLHRHPRLLWGKAAVAAARWQYIEHRS